MRRGIFASTIALLAVAVPAGAATTLPSAALVETRKGDCPVHVSAWTEPDGYAYVSGGWSACEFRDESVYEVGRVGWQVVREDGTRSRLVSLAVSKSTSVGAGGGALTYLQPCTDYPGRFPSGEHELIGRVDYRLWLNGDRMGKRHEAHVEAAVSVTCP